MLHSVTWAAFGEAVLILLVAYYLAVGGACFRKEIMAIIRRLRKRIFLLLVATAGVEGGLRAQTADANNGINQANTLIRSYYDTGTQLMYGIGALLALGGAIHVFIIMGNREQRGDVRTAVIAWLGSCIFLVVVASVIRAFFGL
jgi:hypothetical protein